MIGPSGAGKSSFLKKINRQEKSTAVKLWLRDLM